MPSKEERISYLYLDSKTGDRFDLACNELGWAYKSLVQQCVAAFFAKNREFYAKCAHIDAEARSMSEEDYYETLRDRSEADLQPYKAGRPAFGATPLDQIPNVETGEDNRRRYGVITLSGYNYTLLQVARIVDMGPMVQLISRIIEQHFQTYWETNYLPQIERDKNKAF